MDRFEIRHKIGEGGFSHVYEAMDLTNGKVVAVKLMRQEVVSKDLRDIAMFKNEAEAAISLHHPGIIEIYGAGVFENRPFLIMERLDGRSLQDVMNETEGLDTIACLGIMKSVTGTLAYIHSRGMLHRDIKPGNIMLSGKKSNLTKLIDMAFARAIDWSLSEKLHEDSGSLGYISPEAAGILSRNVDERSDLYSLGITFYHLFTGELPFRAEDAATLVYQHAAFIPPAPSKIKNYIPEAVDKIIMKLIEKDPDKRYRSAVDLMEDLERVDFNSSNSVGYLNRNSMAYKTDLYGRKVEMQKLKEIYLEASSGKGCVCFISGEAGIGKSRLAVEAGRFVQESGGIFISGRCLEFSSKMPYEPFKDALEKYVNYFKSLDAQFAAQEAERLSQALGDTADAAAAFSPLIGSVLQRIRHIENINLSQAEHMMKRFLAAVAKLFESIATHGKVCLLLLDDMQWADNGSIRLLEEIIRTVQHSNLIVLCTVRDNEIEQRQQSPTSSGSWSPIEKAVSGETQSPTDVVQTPRASGARRSSLRELVPDSFRHKRLTKFEQEHPLFSLLGSPENEDTSVIRLKLGPLEMDGLNNLVAGLLRESSVNTGDISSFLLKISDGNPFNVINMLRELVDMDSMRLSTSGMELDMERLEKLSFSLKPASVIEDRLSRTTQFQRYILLMIAAAGGQIDTGLIREAAGKTPGMSVPDVIKELLEYHIIEKRDEIFGDVAMHDRVREILIGTSDCEERKEIHLQLAAAIENSHSGEAGGASFKLTYHFMQGGQPERAAKYAETAADIAADSFANEEAVKLYIFALDYTADVYRLSTRLMSVYILMGRNEDALQLAGKALEAADGSIDRAKVFKLKGRSYFKKGDWPSCEENFKVALHLLGERHVFISRYSGLLLAREAVALLAGTLCSRFFPRPRVDREAQRYKEIVDIYYTVTWMLALKDTDKVLYGSIRALNISRRYLGRSRELAAGTNLLASALMVAGYYRIAARIHNNALKIRRETGDRWGEAQSLQHMAYTLSWQGNQEEGIKHFKQSEEIFSSIGDVWEMGKVLGGLGRGFYLLSDYDGAISAFNAYAELSSYLGDTYGTIVSSYNTLGYIHMEKGEMDKACSMLQKSVEQSRKNGMDFPLCNALHHLGRLELERGNYETAVQYFEQAKTIDKNNRFLKFYTSILYPHYAEAAVKHLRKSKESIHSRIAGIEKETVYRQCIEALTETRHCPSYQGASLRCLALYHALIGKNKKAEVYFIKSINHSRRIKWKYDTAKSIYEYSLFLDSLERTTEAMEARMEAYEIFKGIGAQYFVKKLKEAYENLGSMDTSVNTSLEKLGIERRFDTILEAGRTISSILDMDELLEKILDCSMKLSGAERGAALLYSDNGVLDVRKRSSANTEHMDNNDFVISESIISETLDKGKPVIIADALNEEKLSGRASIILNSLRSVMCVPVKARDRVLGVIYLDNRYLGNLFNEDDMKSVHLLAGQAGISIENAALYGKTAEYAAQIGKSRDEISRLNQDLEKRVEERTVELKTAMDELVKTREQLMNASKMAALGNLMSRIAHEINTPAGNSLTVASHMKRKTGELAEMYKNNEVTKTMFETYLEKSEEASDIIVDNLLKASDIINSFKKVSIDLTAGVRRTFDLKEYIHAILRGLLPDLEKSGHEVSVCCEDGVIVDSYPGALSQVITNLVVNCLVHAFDSDMRGKIIISGNLNGRRLGIEVSDNGKGMELETRDRIFEPFFTTKESEGSTGLGLNIVYNVVTRMLRGSIKCDSSFGEGTSFIIDIPLEEMENDR